MNHEVESLTSKNPTPHIASENTLYLVLVSVALAGYLPTLISAESLFATDVLITIGLGILFILVGVGGHMWVDRKGNLPLLTIYLAFQIALAAFTNFFSPYPGTLWILVLPIVSQGVVGLPKRWTTIFVLIVIAALVIPNGILYGWGGVVINIFSFGAGVVFVMIFTQIYVRENEARTEGQRLAAQLEEANQQLREYAAQVEELAITQERNRLAREIHDSLGHYLTVINMQLEGARAIFENNPQAVLEAIDKSQTLVREGLTEIRRSVAALRASPMEGKPLHEAIEGLLADCRSSGLVAELHLEGDLQAIPAESAYTIYRTTQEGLTNVRKHARASRVDVGITFHEDENIQLVIEDNGVGVDPKSMEEGFGLLGIRERVQLIGGKLGIVSAPKEGFRLEVEIPV